MLDLHSLISVESCGLDVNVHYNSEHRMEILVGQLAHWHSKKRITCRTREMQHQLLDKIDHAIKFHQRVIKETQQQGGSPTAQDQVTRSYCVMMTTSVFRHKKSATSLRQL